MAAAPEVINTAGLGTVQQALTGQPSAQPEQPASSPRREAIRLIRATLRKQDASEDELDDAYEALLELAKD
jgi:hypothetical protein